MMSESMDKTASSMALVERKTQRPTGGCASIFFQLFNWNRSFSKKKLFSNKLLPPAHPQQCSRKFGGDEKFPKNRLMANENSGGFSNMKKNGSCNNDTKQKPQMRPPSLVARLMGLESMPAVQKNKPSRETLDFHTSNDEGDKFTNTQHDFNSNLVKENDKNEARPEKLQKTRQFEHQPLTKFTSEAFQFKSVLSRSKKHHRSKLISPLKSPKISSSSGRTSSRLFDVATKFLEPGLQNTNRGKCAITYTRSSYNTIGNRNDFMMERKNETPDVPKGFDCQLSLKAQSCKHCGSEIELNLEKKPQPLSLSHPKYTNASVEDIKKTSYGPPLSSFEQEKWRVSDRYNELSTPFTAQAKSNKKLFSGDGQSGQCKPQRDPQPSIDHKHRIHRQSQVTNQPNRASSATNYVNHSKNFAPKTPTKSNNIARTEENSSCNKRGESLSPVRKRRSVSGSQNGETSSFSRQKNTRCKSMDEREIRLDSRSFNCNNRKSTMGHYGEKYKNSNVNSFSFNASESSFTRKKPCAFSVSGENYVKTNDEKSVALSGDELGAILQQKLKELSCQEEDDMSIGGSEPKKSTAVILQELISALTNEKRMVCDVVDVESGGKDQRHSPHVSDKRFSFEAKQKTDMASLGYINEGEYHSPGSVLDASFSNDSCLSSTFGDGSEFYFDGLPKLEPDAEHPDSVASIKKGCNDIHLLIDIISHVFEVLLSLGFANTSLKRSKLAYAKDVILNTELVVKNASESISLSHFLVYELEKFASAIWADFGHILGFKVKKHENRIKEFVLDCVIEYLDTRYGRYTSCVFTPWTKIPMCSSTNEFVLELVKEVRWWTDFAEYSLDEIIDFEMSHSYGKWTDFENETYETGAEIGKEVLQILVDEIVIDLFDGKKCSKWV